MPLVLFPTDGGNFGDDLKELLWDELFPDMAEKSEGYRIHGIGTVLSHEDEKNIRTVVLGSGVAGPNDRAARHSTDFRWVRGPLTAKVFGLSAHLGMGDPAILWSGLQGDKVSDGPVGFIPHHLTWTSYDWASIAKDAGMVAINPKQSPDEVAKQIRGCSRILTESLHGAIFADAMGIPWAACVLAHRFNAFKWEDWLATVGRNFSPLIIDRPLARDMGFLKFLVNRCARILKFKRETTYPLLRPVSRSRVSDEQAVVNALVEFVRNNSNFTCSPVDMIHAQRCRMLVECERFAMDYGLIFNSK